MNAEKFWYAWLKVTIILVITVGIAFAFLSRTPLFAFCNKQINHIFFADKLPEKATQMFHGWIAVIMGLLFSLWGLAMFYLTCYFLQKKELWAWRCFLYSFIIWFIIDISFSIYFQSGISIIIDIIFFFQVIAPLLFLKKSLQPSV